MIIDRVDSEIHEVATKQVEQTVKKLEDTAYQVKFRINWYESFKYHLMAGAAIIALIGGWVGSAFIRVTFPSDTFTKAEWNQMEWGGMIQKAWNKLSKEERKKIEALGRGEEYHLKTGSKNKSDDGND